MAIPAFKVKNHVTVPVLKLDGSKPIFIRFEEPIHLAPESDKLREKREADIKAGKQVKPVPEVSKVLNLQDGMVYQIVANEVLKSEIRQNYPDGAYVGKDFMIQKFAPEGNKAYATFQIAEIELDVEEDDQPKELTAGTPEPEVGKLDVPADAVDATTDKAEAVADAAAPAEETQASGSHKRKR